MVFHDSVIFETGGIEKRKKAFLYPTFMSKQIGLFEMFKCFSQRNIKKKYDEITNKSIIYLRFLIIKLIMYYDFE